jgi:RNA polymerase sigma-70 factor (ECF subfamily)
MDDRKARFEVLYTATYEPILGYVLRRCSSTDDAADLVAEVFTVAWRRLDDVPAGDRARLWLYGVARRVVAKHWSKEATRRRRTTSLHPRLQDEIAAPVDDVPDMSAVAQAFRRLPENDRELLRLVAWEGARPRRDRDRPRNVQGSRPRPAAPGPPPTRKRSCARSADPPGSTTTWPSTPW